jgi:hypothetical protein
MEKKTRQDGTWWTTMMFLMFIAHQSIAAEMCYTNATMGREETP